MISVSSPSDHIFIERPELIGRIKNSLDTRRLVLIVAASGYGKTTLLRQLFEDFSDTQKPCIWINVTERGHDAQWLSNQLKANTIRLYGESPDAFKDFPALAQTLSDNQNPLTVIIDNWNFLDASASSLIDRVLLETEGLVKFVISSQNFPSFNHDSYRVSGLLDTLTSENLALNEQQSEKIVCADNVASPKLKQIIERTEGWPVAVQMLRLAVSQSEVHSMSSLDFSGSRLDVGRYLNSSFFNHIPKKLQLFLMNLALFDEFWTELVVHTIGPGSGHLLQQCIQDGMFISETAPNTGRFRMHSLFREFLQSRRPYTDPTKANTLLAKASDFLKQEGYVEEAITLALSAGELEAALDMLVIEGPRINKEGKLAQFISWIKILIRKNANIPTELHKWYIWSLVFTARWNEASQHAAQFHEAMDAELHAVMSVFSDELIALKSGLEVWRRQTQNESPFSLAVIFSAQGIRHMAEGRYNKAAESFHKAEFFVTESESIYGQIWVSVLKGTLELRRGRCRSAERILRQAISLGERYLGSSASIVSVTRQVAALSAWHQCEEAQAKLDMREASKAKTRNSIPYIAVLADWLALELDVEWDPILKPSSLANQRMLLISRCLDIERKLQGNISSSKARRRIEKFDLILNDIIKRDGQDVLLGWGLQSEIAVNKARYYLIVENHRQALAILNTTLLKIKNLGSNLVEIKLLLLKSAALQQKGDQSAALRLLIATTEICVNEGLFKPIVAEKRFLQTLYEPLIEAGKRAPIGDPNGWRELIKLLGTLGHGTKVSNVENRNIEPLTEREFELLKFVDSGLSNAEISRRLSISVPTVKWHLHNLFSKLGVRNRTSAVKTARDFNLLS